MSVTAVSIRSYSADSSWSTQTQVLVIVMVALSIIAIAVGAYVFFEAQGMGIFPFSVVGTLGEIGGSFLLAGGTTIGLINLVIAVAIETRRRNFKREVELTLKNDSLNALAIGSLTVISKESCHVAIYRKSNTEVIAVSSRDKNTAVNNLNAYKST